MRDSIAVNGDLKSRFRAGAKVCSVAILVLLVIGALGPASWTPRTALGWQTDHFIGYFAITLLEPRECTGPGTRSVAASGNV
jgi:hypothetical protein